MFGTSIIRGFGLSGVALLAFTTLAGTATAGGNHGEAPPVYENNYTGPPIIRRIPGLRILFGEQTQGDSTYAQPNEKKKKKNQIDESYYEPQPAQPAGPKSVKTPPAKAATVNPALPQKTASAAPAKPLADGPLSCEKATEVVSGYGFSSVEAAGCSGTVYTFNAKRGGKNFAIKLDSASGQLTDVKKLP